MREGKGDTMRSGNVLNGVRVCVASIVLVLSGGLLSLAAPFVASAQEELTLERAIEFAMDQNRQLQGAQRELDAAHWGQLNSYTNFLPRIELAGGYTRIDPESESRANASVDFIRSSAGQIGIPPSALSNIRPFAYGSTYGAGLTVMQPIYNGGAEILGVQAASAAYDKGLYGLQDTEQDVIARVKVSYYTVLKAQAMVNLAKESSDRTRRYLEMTQRRADMGQRTQTDVLRWEVQRASDEGNLINAENGLATARLILNEVMGVELNRTFAIRKIAFPDSLLADYAPSPEPGVYASSAPFTDALTVDDAFLATHPAMRVMNANLELADLNVSRAWVNFKPRVNVGFQYGYEKNNTIALDGYRPWALSLTVSLPIFNGFGDYTNIQQAKAEYSKAESQVDSYRRILLLQAANAQLTLKAARKRIDITRQAEREALEVLNSVTRRYENGAASNVDLIDVQTAYSSARTNSIAAFFDYYVAQVQYERATGTVTR